MTGRDIDAELVYCHQRREQARELLRLALEDIDLMTARMHELVDAKADARKVTT